MMGKINPQQPPLLGFEHAFFSLGPCAHTTWVLCQSAQLLLMGRKESKEQIFFKKSDKRTTLQPQLFVALLIAFCTALTCMSGCA